MIESQLAKALKARELSEETLMEIEALGFRASQADCKPVLDAVCIVVPALQGNYKAGEVIEPVHPELALNLGKRLMTLRHQFIAFYTAKGLASDPESKRIEEELANIERALYR